MKGVLLNLCLIPFLIPTDGSSLWYKAYKFDNPETIDQDLEVIKEDVPMFIEVDISRKEHVLPIVPAGKSNHEMLGVKFNA